MPKLFQIVVEANRGSVGRIAEQIGETVIENGWSSYITSARESNPSVSEIIRIGSKFDVYFHGIETRIFDNHSFSSRKATKKLVKVIENIKPDIIHLHNLHGYYINVEILFDYISNNNIPVVWTFHDCWSFTGHCTHFEFVGCEKWKGGCYDCEQKHEYPKSMFFDRSRQNYLDKKRIFNSVNNMTIVPVSNWMAGKVKQSFLGHYPRKIIQNGIDLDVFYPKFSREKIDKHYGLHGKFIILGVATNWDKKKGFEEFIKLSRFVDDECALIMVGLKKEQIEKLPEGIIGIQRTENVKQLADLYSAADMFFNPTFEDTFPTTNLEAMACGIPVVTYKTGGSVESVTEDTGIVTRQGDIGEVLTAIDEIRTNGKSFYENNCRNRAVNNFDKNVKFKSYIKLYEEILNEKNLGNK